jgi:2-hydroxychromene-2-carboxylate isomerase
MGDLIRLAERRNGRGPRRRPGERAQFYFDLACPFTYLAAERVDRALPDAVWTPATAVAFRDVLRPDRMRREAEARAAALRLPLVWPERFPAGVPAAMRVAGHAIECGRGAAFAIAAGRLAFCGGFDLDDPEILADAAAAAGLPLESALRAAGDRRRDEAIEAAGADLLAAGAERLPALRVGSALYWGECQIAAALAAAG